jgi:diaminohydroxyphosphoribosylaminopyrimidine deaminase/5-amino-6-(5-phosphoribosylamino)uracil reductase
VDPEVAKALAQTGAELVELPAEDGFVDLGELLRILGQREITSVLVEGGGTLLGSFFDRRLVDKVVAFVAPVVIGGAEAVTPVAGTGVEKMEDAVRLERVVTQTCDDDVIVSGYVGG